MGGMVAYMIFYMNVRPLGSDWVFELGFTGLELVFNQLAVHRFDVVYLHNIVGPCSP